MIVSCAHMASALVPHEKKIHLPRISSTFDPLAQRLRHVTTQLQTLNISHDIPFTTPVCGKQIKINMSCTFRLPLSLRVSLCPNHVVDQIETFQAGCAHDLRPCYRTYVTLAHNNRHNCTDFATSKWKASNRGDLCATDIVLAMKLPAEQAQKSATKFRNSSVTTVRKCTQNNQGLVVRHKRSPICSTTEGQLVDVHNIRCKSASQHPISS